MKIINQWLFSLARSHWMGWLVGVVITRMSFLLPVERLRETENVLAFYHPRPTYPFHVLVVPKRPLRNLMAVTGEDCAFLLELFQIVQSLVLEFNLEEVGYRLVCNGGNNQDVPHLHFHLIAETDSLTDR